MGKKRRAESNRFRQWIERPETVLSLGSMVFGAFMFLSVHMSIPSLVFLVAAVGFVAFEMIRMALKKTWRPSMTSVLIVIVLAASMCFQYQFDTAQLQTTSVRLNELGGLPIATGDELRQEIIENRTVFVSDLAKMEFLEATSSRPIVIKEKTFRDCDVIGPAFLVGDQNFVIRGSYIVSSMEPNFSPDALFMEVELGTSLAGLIGFERCVFQDCSLSLITLVGDHSDVMTWKREFHAR